MLHVVPDPRHDSSTNAYTALQELLVTAPTALRPQLAGIYKQRLI